MIDLAHMDRSNEAGHDGTVRYCKSLTGMWIFEECHRQDAALRTMSYPQILQLAVQAEPLRTLTLREREVFDLYIGGKNSKEIMALLGIGANGLKFHNRNIYSKLGISSKKELLRYAAVLASEKETALSSDRKTESPYP